MTPDQKVGLAFVLIAAAYYAAAGIIRARRVIAGAIEMLDSAHDVFPDDDAPDEDQLARDRADVAELWHKIVTDR